MPQQSTSQSISCCLKNFLILILFSIPAKSQDTLNSVEVRAFPANSAWAMADTLQTDLIKRQHVNYRDYIRKGDLIVALTDSHQVIAWDLTRLDTVSLQVNQAGRKFSAVSLDRMRNVYLGTQSGEVYKLDSKAQNIEQVDSTPYWVWAMGFDQYNELFTVVPYAVYHPSSNRNWQDFGNHTTSRIVKSKFLWLFNRRTDRYFILPTVTYIDSKNRWWLCASAGEFGGDLQVFDLNTHEIYNKELKGLRPEAIQPRSVFEDSTGNIYITSGLQHFISSGEIIRISPDNTVTEIYNSNDYQPPYVEVPGFFAEGLFIGPGAYSHKDNSVIFATDRGLFRGSLVSPDRLTEVERIVFLHLGTTQESLAIGRKLAIKKIEILDDGSVLFLSRVNGFGIYRRGELTFLQ